jgi:5-methylcytosine-specific restriction endonuclease McrA
MNRIISQALTNREQKEKAYRAKALKIYPPICAYCGREFEGKRLRELTVHHKDHNHDNNPEDGSNWELLCIYCHENQHARQNVADAYDKESPGEASDDGLAHRPFANLAQLLKNKKS